MEVSCSEDVLQWICVAMDMCYSVDVLQCTCAVVEMCCSGDVLQWRYAAWRCAAVEMCCMMCGSVDVPDGILLIINISQKIVL